MRYDPSKVQVKANSYVGQKGEDAGQTVKTWDIYGLTGWKSLSVRQGHEVEVLACLDKIREEFKRMASLRIKLDEAQTNLSKARNERDAFRPIFQKYPGDQTSQIMADHEAKVTECEAALKAITG